MFIRNPDNLKIICKLMYETFHIPVFLLNEKGLIILEYSSNYSHNPLYLSKEALIGKLFDPSDSCEYPVFKETNYMENFFSVSLVEKEQFKGCILIGPSVYNHLSEEMIKGIVNDLHTAGKRNELIQYYKSLPVVNHLKFTNASILLYYMIYNMKLDTTTVFQKNEQLEKERVKIKNVDVAVSERREHASFHHDPLFEKELFQKVKEGKKEEIISPSILNPNNGEYGVLSKGSNLRNKKNIAIITIAIATRAAIEGGLNPETSYTLSDLYIQNLEEINEVIKVDSLLKDALYDFTERVYDLKHQNYSRTVINCKDYIFKHLYNDITLSDLSNVVAMNPSYLSTLFKKETNIHISEFIQREKIHEAKKLIIYSNYSLTEIYTLLNFYDQSYFTKIFKKFTGKTPKQFKNSHEHMD